MMQTRESEKKSETKHKKKSLRDLFEKHLRDL